MDVPSSHPMLFIFLFFFWVRRQNMIYSDDFSMKIVFVLTCYRFLLTLLGVHLLQVCGLSEVWRSQQEKCPLLKP